MPQHEAHTLSSTPALDPAMEALVNRLVASRLEDSERQLAAQTEAWKQQHAEMLHRETAMQEALNVLDAKLATAQLQAQQIQRSPISLGSKNSPTALALVPRQTVPDANVPNDNSDSTANPRKRRRGAVAPQAVADTTPARNTRSRTLIATPTVPNMPASVQFVLPNTATKFQPVIPIQPLLAPVQHARSSPKAAKKVVIKPPSQVYRFLRQDMPGDIGGLQKSMALHIRLLWALLDAKDVPKDPSSQLLADFAIRFSTEAQLYACQASGPTLIPLHLVKVGTAMSAIGGCIAIQARFVEEHMLHYLQACLSRFGLDRWCPDLRQSAYSLYNAACRIIALDTFKQALVSHSYLHLNPNTSYSGNMGLLIRLYDHFVFHYMFMRYQKNIRQPGSVMRELQASPQYQGRIRLAAARLQFLEENNYPQRYRDLIDSKATSDDEYDSSSKTFFIKRRPERSSKVNQFFRILDQKREQTARQDKSRRWRERVRVVPTNQQDSIFPVLPEGMPVDYFDPVFFNALQPKTRNRLAIRKVALLPTITDSLTWNAEERLTSQEFAQKYKVVFDAYHMVKDGDIVDAGSDDDEWMDDEAMDDEAGAAIVTPIKHDDEDFDITSSRGALSAHLSESAHQSAHQSGSMTSMTSVA